MMIYVPHTPPGYLSPVSVVICAQLCLTTAHYGLPSALDCHYIGPRLAWNDWNALNQCLWILTSACALSTVQMHGDILGATQSRRYHRAFLRFHTSRLYPPHRTVDSSALLVGGG